jgi:hypothetical protein
MGWGPACPRRSRSHDGAVLRLQSHACKSHAHVLLRNCYSKPSTGTAASQPAAAACLQHCLDQSVSRATMQPHRPALSQQRTSHTTCGHVPEPSASLTHHSQRLQRLQLYRPKGKHMRCTRTKCPCACRVHTQASPCGRHACVGSHVR